ncbi:Peroxiredoxin [Gigaspora rosea]|uniref:thioredoxin-dependent peroxiredoxin n=1 Tax=Gigaspora rosea TaxID=44941 RepID=A0A397TXX6_9GLOM|nr:Peroxiredoxin [Gigaspora rosea]CAG8732830.1 10676_t:CDS:2 [Gigaspora rosea]
MSSLLKKPAPTNLTLKNQDGEDVCLGDFVGKKPTIVFFYPKDETYGCTREVCSFRDSHSVFSEAGAIVVGVSSDSIESHKRFAERQNLPYQLLSDPNGEARKAFDVSPTLGILPGRVTYLINKEGIVEDIFNSQLDFNGHAKRAVEFIKSHA